MLDKSDISQEAAHLQEAVLQEDSIAQQAARAQEIVMTGVYPVAPPNWFKGRLARKINVRLAGCAAGLLLALLLAPGSRRLFLAQAGMTVPLPANIASIAGSQVGLNEDPFYGGIATPAAHAAARRSPNDLQMQIADACTLLPHGPSYTLPPGGDVPPSILKVQRLRALEGRFGDRPALYANILRYEAQGAIRARHEAEQCAIDGTPVPVIPVPVIPVPGAAGRKELSPAEKLKKAASYTAYDHDAAQGERLDPDNAYFPFMRAVGLCGAHRDDEAIAAITRAAHKSLWREYYNDELRGAWKLQDTAFVNNSVLLHTIAAASLLFPQYAQMRDATRVTIYKAMQAEQAGHIREGLKLREDVLRLGSLMRVQSSNLIGTIVGDALTDNALLRPAGLPASRETFGSDAKERQTRTARRKQFDSYLERIDAMDAAPVFHAAQQAGDETREIIRMGVDKRSFDRPLRTLMLWWVADILVLSSILWLLVSGGSACLAARNSRIKAGLPLPLYARFALPLGLLGGVLAAPFLLEGLSPYFEHISGDNRTWMLLAGFAPVLAVLGFPAEMRLERLRRVAAFGCGLLVGVVLTGFCAWQGRGLAGVITLSDVFFNLSSETDTAGPALSANLLWLAPCVCGLIFMVLAAISRLCRVPVSVGLARGLRGLMVPVCAGLFLIYGVMLLFTIRAERSMQYDLDRTLENEGQVIADLSGKQWPRSDVAKKMAGP